MHVRSVFAQAVFLLLGIVVACGDDETQSDYKIRCAPLHSRGDDNACQCDASMSIKANGQVDEGIGNCAPHANQLCCVTGPYPSANGSCLCSAHFSGQCVKRDDGDGYLHCTCRYHEALEGKEVEVDSCPEMGGQTCCDDGKGRCECYTKGTGTCDADETKVSSCEKPPPTCDMSRYESGGVALVQVKDCKETVSSTTAAGTPPSSSTDAGGSSSTDSGAAKCTAKGFCGPTLDRCDCGYSCIQYGAGEYTCGISCTTDADCKGKTDPLTGQAFTRCLPAFETNAIHYQTNCE